MARYAYDTKYETIFAILFGATSLEELRKFARPFIVKFHPDRGGDPEAMVALNAIIAKLSESFVNRSGKRYAEETGKAYAPNESVNEKVAAAIRFVMGLDGIAAELCGTWLYVSGDTKPHKEALKANGFLWSGPKKMWYFNGQPKKRYFGKSKSMDYIRMMHGSDKVK